MWPITKIANPEMRKMDKKSIDGWCMKEEGETDEKKKLACS